MIKSELVKRIASQTPHLYDRDIEKVVNAIFGEMVDALRRGDRVELRGSGPFQSSSERHDKGAILKPALSSRSERKLCPTSRQGRRCERGLLRKPSRHSSTLTNKGRVSPCPPQRSRLHLSKKKGTGTMAGPPQSKAR